MSKERAPSDPPVPEPFDRGNPESTFYLIERARAGDQEAIERLFARHLKPLQRWISRSDGGIRGSARFRLHIEGVRTRVTVDGIDGIVDGHVHHRVDARFMEWVVERSEAGRGGSHTGVCVPDGDGIAARWGSEGGRLTFRT